MADLKRLNSVWFPLLSLVESDTSVICHVLVYSLDCAMADLKRLKFCVISAVIFSWVWHLRYLPCVSVFFWIISIAKICFQVSKYLLLRTKIWPHLLWMCCYLHSKLWRRTRLLLELFASTVERFLSRVSYLPSDPTFFLLTCRSFTSRKLYVCPEKLSCLSCINWSSSRLELVVKVSFSFDSSSTTGFRFNSLRASLLTVLRVVYAIFRLSSGKTMVSILHVDLISCRYLLNIVYVWSC